MLKKNTKYKHD